MIIPIEELYKNKENFNFFKLEREKEYNPLDNDEITVDLEKVQLAYLIPIRVLQRDGKLYFNMSLCLDLGHVRIYLKRNEKSEYLFKLYEKKDEKI